MSTQRVRVLIVHRNNPFRWDGTHLGNLHLNQIKELGRIKIGRQLNLTQITIGTFKALCLTKTILSVLPAIFDEIKPIFFLPKVGTHTFRYRGHLMIAYRPIVRNGEIQEEITLDEASDELRDKRASQVRRLLAFREIFGITETFERSLVIRASHVLSFLEPNTIAGSRDGFRSIISELLLKRWFSQGSSSLERTIHDLICLNRDTPEATIAYYRPLVEEVINKIDPELITYANLFFQRLTSYLPY